MSPRNVLLTSLFRYAHLSQRKHNPAKWEHATRELMGEVKRTVRNRVSQEHLRDDIVCDVLLDMCEALKTTGLLGSTKYSYHKNFLGMLNFRVLDARKKRIRLERMEMGKDPDQLTAIANGRLIKEPPGGADLVSFALDLLARRITDSFNYEVFASMRRGMTFTAIAGETRRSESMVGERWRGMIARWRADTSLERRLFDMALPRLEDMRRRAEDGERS